MIHKFYFFEIIKREGRTSLRVDDPKASRDQSHKRNVGATAVQHKKCEAIF